MVNDLGVKGFVREAAVVQGKSQPLAGQVKQKCPQAWDGLSWLSLEFLHLFPPFR